MSYLINSISVETKRITVDKDSKPDDWLDDDLTIAEKAMFNEVLVEYLVPRYGQLTSFLNRTWRLMQDLVPLL